VTRKELKAQVIKQPTYKNKKKWPKVSNDAAEEIQDAGEAKSRWMMPRTR
jgi:hypothetical protein